MLQAVRSQYQMLIKRPLVPLNTFDPIHRMQEHLIYPCKAGDEKLGKELTLILSPNGSIIEKLFFFKRNYHVKPEWAIDVLKKCLLEKLTDIKNTSEAAL